MLREKREAVKGKLGCEGKVRGLREKLWGGGKVRGLR